MRKCKAKKTSSNYWEPHAPWENFHDVLKMYSGQNNQGITKRTSRSRTRNDFFLPLLLIHNTNLNDSCRVQLPYNLITPKIWLSNLFKLPTPTKFVHKKSNKVRSSWRKPSQPISTFKALDPSRAIFLLSPRCIETQPRWLVGKKIVFCQGTFDTTSKGVPWLAPNHSVHFRWPSKQTNWVRSYC